MISKKRVVVAWIFVWKTRILRSLPTFIFILSPKIFFHCCKFPASRHKALEIMCRKFHHCFFCYFFPLKRNSEFRRYVLNNMKRKCIEKHSRLTAVNVCSKYFLLLSSEGLTYELARRTLWTVSWHLCLITQRITFCTINFNMENFSYFTNIISFLQCNLHIRSYCFKLNLVIFSKQ